MRIPYTISKNVFAAYRCSMHTLLLPHEQNRTICPENESWDDNVIPDVKVLALRVLVDQWKEYPILDELPTCVDRDMLLEMLPTDLPFDLVIRRIPDEIYWKRAAQDRWEYNYPTEHGDSWRQLYCERHFAEYLEGLEASYFHVKQKDCDELITLVSDCIHILRIRALIPCKEPVKRTDEEDEDQCTTEDFPVDHIPMNVILPQLPHLRELYINFGLIYMNDGFEWRDFKFSVEDCAKLGRGIKECRKLKKFSLTRSNLDQRRVAALLQGIAVNNVIEDVDLSHCKLGDTGAHAIGEFLTMHKHLKSLRLANNQIGASGIAGIVHGLLQDNSTPLKHLDLRLNPLEDAGGVHICALLLRHGGLESLNLSGCGLTTETGIGMAECIASGYLKFFSLDIDVSNNDFGPIAGEGFEIAVKSCPNIVGLDGRMCNFSKESEYTISETVARNREDRKKDRARIQRRSSVALPPRGATILPPIAFEHMQVPGDLTFDESVRDINAYPQGDVSFAEFPGAETRSNLMMASSSGQMGESRMTVKSGVTISGTASTIKSGIQLLDKRSQSHKSGITVTRSRPRVRSLLFGSPQRAGSMGSALMNLMDNTDQQRTTIQIETPDVQ